MNIWNERSIHIFKCVNIKLPKSDRLIVSNETFVDQVDISLMLDPCQCSYLERDILKKRYRHYFGDLQRTNLKKISEWGVIENK